MTGRRKAEATRKQDASAKPKRGLFRRLVAWLLVILIVVGLLAVGAFLIAYNRLDIPDPNRDFETENTLLYYDDGKTELGSFEVQNRESLAFDDMPACMKSAVVAAEDRTFWTNKGIDPKGILRAAFSNARGGSTQGASTITQQYVKILYLTQERTLTRKVKEAILSLKLQKRVSKQEILQGYLNTIYFGRGAYGVQAASQAWFGIDADQLNTRQCVVLASVINNPTQFDPRNGKDNRAALLERYRYVLGGMVDAGDLEPAEGAKAERALPTIPTLQSEDKYGGQRGHVLTLVKQQLLTLPGITEEMVDGGGLRVTTTLRKQDMAAAKAGVDEVRPDLGADNKNLHAAVASVEPGTGALRGFYAGQNYLESQINWAVSGGSPGSAFKPFAVAAGIKAGYSLNDVFDGNSPIELPDGSDVVNEGAGDGTDYGSAVSLLTATEESINTAFIDMTLGMGEEGPQEIVDTATSLGIAPEKADKAIGGIPTTSPGLEPNLGISLGSLTASPINMANAYASVADGGVRHDVFVIKKVTEADGTELYEHDDDGDRVLDEDIAADTSYAMQQVVSAGTGTAALALGRPAAGKTGTATNADGDVSSSWFVGYTPQLATAVMYVRGTGNEQIDGWLPDYNGLAGYFGANYPARTWTSVMQRAMEGVDVEDFPDPVFVDGEAPDSGDDSYVPPATNEAPPPPPETSQPSQPETSEAPPSSFGTPEPPSSPTDPPTETGGPTDPPTETGGPTDPPTETGGPSPSGGPSPTDGGGDGGGGGNGGGNEGGSGGNAGADDRVAATVTPRHRLLLPTAWPHSAWSPR